MQSVVGIILAGGQGKRMGGADKAFLPFGQTTLIEHAAARARPQVDDLAVNANGAVERFAKLGLPVVADDIGGFAGPLAGLLTGLSWAKTHRPHAAWIAGFPCDTPFFPHDLVARLVAAALAAQVRVAVPASGGRIHPVFALIHTEVSDTASGVVAGEKLARATDWIERQPHARVEFPEVPDPFFNINTREDLTEALSREPKP